MFDTTITATVKDTGTSALKTTVLTGLSYDTAKILAAGLAYLAVDHGSIAAVLSVALTLTGAILLTRQTPHMPLHHGPGSAWGKWARPAVPGLLVLGTMALTAGSLLFWQGALALDSATAFLVVNLSLSVGSVCGNLMLGRVGLERRYLRIGIILTGIGLMIGGMAGPERLLLLGLGGLIWGLGFAWSFNCLRGWLVSSAPRGCRGRAGTTLVVTNRLALTVSGPVLGLLLAATGVTTATILLAVLMMLVALLLPQRTVWAASSGGA